MALPEKRSELNRIDEQRALGRLDEHIDHPVNQRRLEEHHAVEDREYRDAHRHEGHAFAKDIHPERYPRESLSTLEEGILDDDEKRQAHDRLGYVGPDRESRIDDSRSFTRTLIVLGSFLLAFAWALLLFVGWDLRSGEIFFTAMCGIAVLIGLGLIGWGFIERRSVSRLRATVIDSNDERTERERREHRLRPGDRAA